MATTNGGVFLPQICQQVAASRRAKMGQQDLAAVIAKESDLA
jgi:hypothetical protein